MVKFHTNDYVIGTNFIGKVVLVCKQGYIIEVVSGQNKGKRNSELIPIEQFEKVYNLIEDLTIAELLYG